MCNNFECVHTKACINEFICEEYRAYCIFRTKNSIACDICQHAKVCAKGKAILARQKLEKNRER